VQGRLFLVQQKIDLVVVGFGHNINIHDKRL
jgi:hypothetical protein